MFYMLANIHHQIATDEVLPPLDRFWYYLGPAFQDPESGSILPARAGAPC
jgi:hypothetical protein